MTTYTYDKRLGIKNTKQKPITKEAAERLGRPELEGAVMEWYTLDLKPMMIPDQWGGEDSGWWDGNVERIPDNLEVSKTPPARIDSDRVE